MRIFFVFALALAALPAFAEVSAPVIATSLELEAYLAQVSDGNLALKASRSTDAALRLVTLEPRTMLSPYFSASAQYFDDQTEPTSPFSTERVTSSQFEAGLNQQIEWTGTRLGLSFKESNNAIKLPPSFFSPGSDYFFASSNGFTASLSQSLIKDWGAAGYKVLQRKVDASMAQARLMNQLGGAAVLLEAEGTYLTLASLQEIGRLLQDSLERNQKILQWTKGKFADDLADKVDVLQVEAAVKMVDAGLRQVRAEAARAAERFNHLRGRDLKEEVGQLALPTAPAALPEPKTRRLDLQAAARHIEGQDALVDEVRQRHTPDLVLFGQATATGSDHGSMAGVSPDSSKTWDFDHPTYLVGAKLTTSLDWVLYQKVVSAAKLGADQSRQDLAAKEKKADQDWASLRGQWEALQEQLVIAQELEALQKEKAEREKRRYFDGRTTNFQVLRFEEDYNQARIAGMRLRAQALALAAQARFYNREGF